VIKNPTSLCIVEGCDKPQYVASSGYCSKHYQRWRTHGTTERRSSHGLPTRDRFMRFVSVDQRGCWLWTGRIGTGGYGYFGQKVDGVRKTRRAHRVSYELFVGPIPEGQQVDHLCHVRACVNPDHLEAVRPVTNNLRSTSPSAANARRTECRRGHPLSGDNLQVIRTNGRAKRRCKACARASRRLRAITGGAAS